MRQGGGYIVVIMNIECSICGGSNEIEEGQSSYVCKYCGERQAVPVRMKASSAGIFNRANELRRQGEFDRAQRLLQKALMDNPDDAGMRWNLVLNRYGIEYVQDPHTMEYKPTCHRVRRQSVLKDADFLRVLDGTEDGETRKIYTDQVAAIDQIRMGILTVADHEEPYDVFICYKESTEGGSRTQDSVLAEEIYTALEREGLRVFYARHTLQDKLGTQYEPYIYAALSTAGVMLLVATEPEYMDAVWVRNEWGRYLDFMKDDPYKVLIPCYQKMSPYDFPEELSRFEGIDMDGVGAKQDLVYEVKKICERAQKRRSGNSVLERGRMLLEDRSFDDARTLFERALKDNPSDIHAMLGMLCVEHRIRRTEDFADIRAQLEKEKWFSRAVSAASPDEKEELADLAAHVEELRLEKCRRSEAQALDYISDRKFDKAKAELGKVDQWMALTSGKKPKQANYYLAHLLADRKAVSLQDIADWTIPISSSQWYEDLLRCADPDLRQQLTEKNDIQTGKARESLEGSVDRFGEILGKANPVDFMGDEDRKICNGYEDRREELCDTIASTKKNRYFFSLRSVLQNTWEALGWKFVITTIILFVTRVLWTQLLFIPVSKIFMHGSEDGFSDFDTACYKWFLRIVPLIILAVLIHEIVDEITIKHKLNRENREKLLKEEQALNNMDQEHEAAVKRAEFARRNMLDQVEKLKADRDNLGRRWCRDEKVLKNCGRAIRASEWGSEEEQVQAVIGCLRTLSQA